MANEPLYKVGDLLIRTSRIKLESVVREVLKVKIEADGNVYYTVTSTLPGETRFFSESHIKFYYVKATALAEGLYGKV